MFIGYYKCDKCNNDINDVLTVRRWLINGQYSTEELPAVAKEYLLKKEFCNGCATKIKNLIKDWNDTPFEELEKRRQTAWVYTKDKLPEVPEEGDPDYFVALKQTKTIAIWKLSEIIEDQKEKDPEDEESEEGEHLIYAWAEMFTTPYLEPESTEEDPVEDENGDPEGPDPDDPNTEPDEPEENP